MIRDRIRQLATVLLSLLLFLPFMPTASALPIADYIVEWENGVEGTVNVTKTAEYDTLFSGFAFSGTAADCAQIAVLPEVKCVYPARQYTTMPLPAPDRAEALVRLQEAGGGGAGRAIAVLDSEFDITHPCFAALSAETAVKYTEAAIAANSDLLHADVTNTYKSTKIPFAYDYGNDDANTTAPTGTGQHGTGVASVAAGGGEFPSPAADSQLLLMKTYTDAGICTDVQLLAALEDAVTLDADVINISLGFEVGFVSEGIEYETLFARARAAGSLVFCAAGNNGTLGRTTAGGDARPFAACPDYGTLSMPASTDAATAVSSMRKTDAPVQNTDGFWCAAGNVYAFSSRGTTSDLQLKPEISAIGTVSVANGTGYLTQQGTSFSAPTVSAAAAALMAARDLENAQLTENLLMSTATVLAKDGIPYSPRIQGSGFLNLEAALASPVVLYGSDGRTKIATNGSNTFSFTVQNLSANAVTYHVCGAVITDACSADTVPRVESFSRRLGAIAPVADVTVAANSTQTVTVTVLPDAAAESACAASFTNGYFAEGYVQLYNESNTVSIPFMGFCGDWNDVPIFDAPVSRDGGFYGVTGLLNTASQYLGKDFQGVVQDDRMATKPTAETAAAFALLRNVTALTLTVENADSTVVKTQTLTSQDGDASLRKAYFQGTAPCYAITETWTWTDDDGNQLPDGTYLCRLTAVPDTVDKTPQTQSYTVEVDSVPPQINDLLYIQMTADMRLGIEAADNHAILAIGISNTAYNKFAVPQDGVAVFGSTGIDYRYVQVWDYAGNMTATEVKLHRGRMAQYAEETKMTAVQTVTLPVWNNRIIIHLDDPVRESALTQLFLWDGLRPTTKNLAFIKDETP